LDRIQCVDKLTEEKSSHQFMLDYIQQLLNTFPQLEINLTNPVQPQEKVNASTTKIKDDEDLFAQLNQNFDLLEQEPNSKNSLETEDDLNIINTRKEDDLFAQLSQAIESSVSDNSADETLHELFDEILTEQEQINPNTLSDVDSQLIQPAILPQHLEEPSIDNNPQVIKSEVITPEVIEPEVIKSKLIKSKFIKKEPLKSPIADKKLLKRSVRVDAHKIDTLMNQVGELIVDKGYFNQLFNELRLLQKELKEKANLNNKELKQIRAFSFRFAEAIVSFSRTSNDLQEGVMKIRMLPISQLFDRYPRLIHDLIHRTDKKVNLKVQGEETELDKMIIEEISDPLIHLIRNAVDHGIETIAERKAAGKPETATLLLEAYNESNHIVIEISDDGRGIDIEKIKTKALEKSLYNHEELARMSQKELIHLILLPGFSTATEVSNTSGRGVGMDVVKKNIEKLNGILEIDSKLGIYTKMRLKIPLTLAIIRALQVRVGNSFFTIPLSNVEETLRIYNKETSMMEGTKVIHLRGKTLPIINLSQLFNIASDNHSSEKFFVVTVNTGMQQIGLIVDELLGQAEVVIKPLVDYLQEKSGFSGATIIGDGKISLILDIYELMKMSTNKQVLWHQQQTVKRETDVLNEQN
jgi:two-component system chemotaxis sensor kinase CheA